MLLLTKICLEEGFYSESKYIVAGRQAVWNSTLLGDHRSLPSHGAMVTPHPMDSLQLQFTVTVLQARN